MSIEINEEELIKAFKRNNMELFFVDNREMLYDYLKKKLVNQKKVVVGGSQTLSELGIIELLRNSDVNFIDRYEEGLTSEQLKQRFREGFTADIFMSSTNALTMEGCLYNIDGNGNRVAPMIYGPDEVLIIAGLNKICVDEKAAIERIRTIAAPLNAKRLNCQTPCVKTGKCEDCLSKDRICSSYVKLSYQQQPGRIKIIIVRENLGY